MWELARGEVGYPRELVAHLGDDAPARIRGIGNPDVLKGKALGLVCSVKCPGQIILKTYDLACGLRDGGVTVIGGFHSPMEKECLVLLLRGRQPVIVCPARSIESMRIPSAWRAPLQEGRLLLLSPFEKKRRRATAKLARLRNRFVAALADSLMVPYAEPGGRTEELCRELVRWGKPLFTLESDHNATLVELGACPAAPESLCLLRP